MLNIILLGLVSFFSDAAAEMVYPLIPLYLTSALGATPALVGIIEGIAESTSSLLKVFSGYFTDKYHRKKPVAFVGYATGIIYKLALVFAGTWAGILAARVIDRIGKGIRTAPRDVLVSESADGGKMGKAFGVHKALDMAGSALGILLAYLLLRSISGSETDYKKFFLLSMIPSALGLAALLFVREKKVERSAKRRESLITGFRKTDKRLRLYLLVTLIFTLGNSSNTFLLLRAVSVGFTNANTVLLYLAFNLTAALFSVPFGRLSDKIGRKKLLVGGYLTFSLVYAGFAFATSKAAIIAVFIIYGVYTAMTAGAERALIAEASPPELKGTMLGLQSSIAGLALLPASVIAGALWQNVGAWAPFMLGASLSLVAALILTLRCK